jgi:GDP-L-fucose synthase
LNALNLSSKVYIAGHNGLVGSALVRAWQAAGFTNIIGRRSAELDLRCQQAVEDFFMIEKPEYVLLAAAKVGGILANSTQPAPFLYDNLMMEVNIIHAAWRHGVKKLLFLGSSCIYPQLAPQPIKEESLLTGPLEPTNEAYAIAKITGLKLCEMYNRQYGTCFISVMPTNLYGPNDNFNLETSHVLPALIRKFHEAKLSGAPQVVVWGTGSPVREFLHVDDLAAACLHLMQTYDGAQGIVNVGTGTGVTIAELAELIKQVVGYQGELVFDTSKPDGTPVKINDNSRLRSLGWEPTISLPEGLERTYRWYVKEAVNVD